VTSTMLGTCREFCSLRNSCCRELCCVLFCIPLVLGGAVAVTFAGLLVEHFVLTPLGWVNSAAVLSDGWLLARWFGVGILCLLCIMWWVLVVGLIISCMRSCIREAWQEAKTRAEEQEQAMLLLHQHQQREK